MNIIELNILMYMTINEGIFLCLRRYCLHSKTLDISIRNNTFSLTLIECIVAC